MEKEKFDYIKETLNKTSADAWLIVDYENQNQMTSKLFGHMMLTRKIVIGLVASGRNFIICHSIDSLFLNKQEIRDQFDLHIYNTWQELLSLQKETTKDFRTIMMDISENGLVQTISLADFGSGKFYESLGLKIISSGDLLQFFSSVYDKRSFDLQLKAEKKLMTIKDEAFGLIKKDILQSGVSDEYRIQQFISSRFREENMFFDEDSIVAIGSNASNPHYGPTKNKSSVIKKGDLVLIDLWAKMDEEGAVYADQTWMAYVGSEVPEIYAKRFGVLRKAVDEAFAFIDENIKIRPIKGYEVDDVSRRVVTAAGYGKYFTHRTGHSIADGVSPHGPGANIDNYETHETRSLIKRTSFSLEPGIYAPDFGMRSETNVYISEDGPIMIGGRQEVITPILK